MMNISLKKKQQKPPNKTQTEKKSPLPPQKNQKKTPWPPFMDFKLNILQIKVSQLASLWKSITTDGFLKSKW